MPDILFINAMSRNGASLVYQLLAGHPDIYLYPAQVNLALARPRCFPLLGYRGMGPESLYEELLKRHAVFSGETWQEVRRDEAGALQGRERELFRARVLARFAQVDRPLSDAAPPAGAYFRAFMEEFVEAREGPTGRMRLDSARYVIMQDDHAFNCGAAGWSCCLGPVRSLQIIRRLPDVIASRKNMLLFHLGFLGEPGGRTLKPEVVRDEAWRWTWSVLVAGMLRQALGTDYLVLSFEMLKQEGRRRGMGYLLDRLGLPWWEGVLEESGDMAALGGTPLLLVRSSLSQVTGGRSTRPVGSSGVTLNAAEREVLAECMAEFEGLTLTAMAPDDYEQEVMALWRINQARVEGHPLLGRWLADFRAGRYDKVMEAYSERNHGGAQAGEAFMA